MRGPPPAHDHDEEDELDENDLEAALLEQLHELHRELAQVREDGVNFDKPGRFVGENNKIIICSMRRCIRMEKSSEDDSWTYIPSRGGFKSAIDTLSQSNTVQWVSWPGTVVDEASQDGVRRKLETEYHCKPVFLSTDILDSFHHKFCNVILWPLMHCLPHRSDLGLLDNFMEQYDAYCSANQEFLSSVSEIYNEGDIVIVCDYQLMNLPGLLRRRYSDIICAFFLHCPFPSSEFYRMLPVRQSLLHGMLGADLVVFNHFDYVRHFLNVCTRMLGLESSPSRIEYNGRLVSLGICPLGINPEKFAISTQVKSHIDTLAQRYQGLKCIVGVDKLDFCKGIIEKIEAMEQLMLNFPEWIGKVVFFVIVQDCGRINSIQYQLLYKKINEMVGKVNGAFGSAEYCPIIYLNSSLQTEELTALYNIADVAIVTSLKEGINLQAMEFIASQRDNCKGVLVYSEFAGCASSFKGALLVNPFDAEQVASSVDAALRMTKTTKQIRHHQLSRYVHTYTCHLWSQRLLIALKQADATSREYNVLDKLDITQVHGYYQRSRKRLFLLDYDGTLVPFQSMMQLANPSQSLLSCLSAITEDPNNAVYVISGRNKECLHKWFGTIPRIGLAAENSFWFRPCAEDDTDIAEWQCHDHNIDLKWREEVEDLLEHFTKRTPGSLLESKDASFTWHFRDADPEFGLNQAKDLQLHLDQMLRQRPVGVIMAPLKKYVVVRPARLSKGRAVTRIMNYESPNTFATTADFDFILSIGDERTDEDMFDAVTGTNTFTCTVGRKVSRAQYYVDDPEEVIGILSALTSIETINEN